MELATPSEIDNYPTSCHRRNTNGLVAHLAWCQSDAFCLGLRNLRDGVFTVVQSTARTGAMKPPCSRRLTHIDRATSLVAMFVGLARRHQARQGKNDKSSKQIFQRRSKLKHFIPRKMHYNTISKNHASACRSYPTFLLPL